MSISSDERRRLEIERGALRLKERQAVLSMGVEPEAAPAEPPPVVPGEPVRLSVTGVGNYEVGQSVGTTVVSDAPVTEEQLATARGTEVQEAVRLYSREELEAIGENGIDDLRAISKPMGINGKSKAEIIEEILAAQAPAEAPQE